MKKALILTIALLFMIIGMSSGARTEELTVRFFDIDRNDGILIECGGEAAFLDSGVHDYGQRAVEKMRKLGVKKLKYYIGTHAHKDHVGGGSVILAALHPEAVLQPHEGVHRRIVSCAETEQERVATDMAVYRTVRPGEEILLKDAVITVLGPIRLREPNEISDMENNNSLVLKVSYGRRSFLLTADAMPEELSEVAEVYGDRFACDVLKSPHHNSEPGEELLKLASPDYVVFSTSDRAMPTKTALSSVISAGSLPLITATKQCGMITIHTDGDNLTIEVENEPDRISFREQTITVYAGAKKNPVAETKPAGYKAILFSSDDPGIAFVDGNGMVYGWRPGKTTIRATLPSGLSAQCAVTVKPVSVSLNVNSFILKPGETRRLRMKIRPESAKASVHWESDNPSVATVSRIGIVKAISSGTTIIRISGPGGAVAMCEVTVP